MTTSKGSLPLLENKQQIRRQKRTPQKLYLILSLIVFICVIGTGLGGVGYQGFRASYQRAFSLAQVGVQDMRTGATLLATLQRSPFDLALVEHAQGDFTAALTGFTQVDKELQSFPSITTLIPVYGGRLNTALHLTAMAVALSQAGIDSCNILHILIAKLHNPLDAHKQGLSMQDIASIARNGAQIESMLNHTIAEAQQIQPNDVQFEPRVSSMLTMFQIAVPTLRVWLTTIAKLLPALPTLLGVTTPSNYLIEVLDATELRPAGGFIGNYGLATVSAAQLTQTVVTDVDLLDKPFEMSGHRIPYPPAYRWFSTYLAPESWSFRDSNLEADFPTSARNGEFTYLREGGKAPVQGVIAITPTLIQKALAMTGPIFIPEYHETVTAQNLIALIHYHQLGGRPAGEGSDLIPSPDGHSSLRKRFTALLAEHFMGRVRQLSPGIFSKLMQLLVGSLYTKDIQLYLNDSDAEHVLQLLHLDGAIQPNPDDGFFVVDANVSPNKANSFISNTIDDQISIDSQGNAVHRTTVRYAWTVPGRNYGSQRYRDYVRIYVPSGSSLSRQDGWQPFGTSTAFGDQVWTGFFTLTYGQTRSVTLVWTLPRAAKKDTSGWHYQYMLQKQAGVQRMLHVQVILPACATITGKWGGLTGLTASNKQEITLTQPLTQDVNVGISYTC